MSIEGKPSLLVTRCSLLFLFWQALLQLHLNLVSADVWSLPGVNLLPDIYGTGIVQLFVTFLLYTLYVLLELFDNLIEPRCKISFAFIN